MKTRLPADQNKSINFIVLTASMCYSNGQKIASAELIELKKLRQPVTNYKFLDKPVQLGFDFGPVVVLKPTEDRCNFEIVQMEWGFIPDPMGWPFIETRAQLNRVRRGYTDERGRFHQPLNFLNAVSEELLQKNKVYRKAALERRCLVLSTGFYEWRHVYGTNKRTGEPLKTAVKYPYRVSLKGHDYFWLAGIWNPWTDAETGEYVESCAIITTKANSVMAEIHNTKMRMPTILPDEEAWEWVFGQPDEKRISELAQFQLPSDQLSYYTLAKDFLQSTDPLKEVVQPTLPRMACDPPADDREPQLELF